MEYKHLPVTEERWRQLHQMKRPGETWDELVGRLAENEEKEVPTA